GDLSFPQESRSSKAYRFRHRCAGQRSDKPSNFLSTHSACFVRQRIAREPKRCAAAGQLQLTDKGRLRLRCDPPQSVKPVPPLGQHRKTTANLIYSRIERRTAEL